MAANDATLLRLTLAAVTGRKRGGESGPRRAGVTDAGRGGGLWVDYAAPSGTGEHR